MNWWGKLLGGAFGYLLAGPLGAMVGVALGHNFDRGLGSALRAQFDPGAQERVQAAFFTAVFSIMGYLAKADGRVTEHEIKLARDVMQRMSLNEDMRITAINLFNQGKQAEFSLDDVLQQFRTECHRRRNLMQMFVEILMHAAYADGRVDPAEQAVLERVRVTLGFSQREFNHIEALVRNARHFGGGGFEQGEQISPEAALKGAYEILGVEKTSSDAVVKKAYRRLMNQHHPDKLVSKGLPEEMIKLATEKTQEIKQAYEMIKAARA
ncbi:DnaJ-like protein DjlA [hydrothermal vent metagenome]|uniref:DnaJ-like protein DjlA n=1 Tax=hydrothermal vent metagenome TaxID=652676 RepID=A0A3B0YKA1_9ZZZZ